MDTIAGTGRAPDPHELGAPSRVVIAGAGPVGLVAAGVLVQRGVPVTVLEAGPALATQSRASTFHPPTLDMLDTLGVAQPLVAQGLIAPTLQYRTRDETLATFDFAAIDDRTKHPFRLQAEQSKLTRLLSEKLQGNPLFELAFDSPVTHVEQTADAVRIDVGGGNARRITASWLIGADGASSAVRKALGIAFEGFTWPERFLVVSTPHDFDADLADLASVTYVADPVQWHFYLRVPGMWRIMFPIREDVDDETCQSDAFVQRQMASLALGPRPYEIAHVTLYKVHQRVAQEWRKGRAFLAGDAAHVNNPLGGMGMNGGIHDSFNLAERLANVWHGQQPDEHLDGYERQRRGVTVEFVQTQTIRNKENLEASDPAAHAAFKERLRATAADPAKTRTLLLDTSMINSLARAAVL